MPMLPSSDRQSHGRRLLSSNLDTPWGLFLPVFTIAALLTFALFMTKTRLEGVDAFLWSISLGMLVASIFYERWARRVPGRKAVNEVQLAGDALFVRLYGRWTRIPLVAVIDVETHDGPEMPYACVRVRWLKGRGRRMWFDFHPFGTGSLHDAQEVRRSILDARAGVRQGFGVYGASAMVGASSDAGMLEAPPTAAINPEEGEGNSPGSEAAMRLSVPGRESSERNIAGENHANAINQDVMVHVRVDDEPAFIRADVPGVSVTPIRLSASRRYEQYWHPLQFIVPGVIAGVLVSVFKRDVLTGFAACVLISIHQYIRYRRASVDLVTDVYLVGDLLEFIRDGRRVRIPLADILEVLPEGYDLGYTHYYVRYLRAGRVPAQACFAPGKEASTLGAHGEPAWPLTRRVEEILRRRQIDDTERALH